MRAGKLLMLLCLLLALLIVAATPWPVLQQTLTGLIALDTSAQACPNVAPDPDYYVAGGEQAAIEAINHARWQEGLPALSLPSGYWQLSAAQQQFVLVNLERTSRGLDALQWDELLAQIATAYSLQMVQLHFFSHSSPISGDFPARLEANPQIAGHYQAIAENIAGNWAPAAGAVYEFLYHDAAEQCAHRQNILNPQLQLIGIGVVPGGPWRAMSTQEFLASNPANPYRGALPATASPTISLSATTDAPKTSLTVRAAVSATDGIIQIAWFLDGLQEPSHQGATWTLTSALLVPGLHHLSVYGVDANQNFASALLSVHVGAQGLVAVP